MEKMHNSLMAALAKPSLSSLASAHRVSGFQGQRLVVVHPPQIARASRMALLRPFCPTDIGVFPEAGGHERRRPEGSQQTIFIRCLRGSGWCELGGIRHEVREGDLLVLPAGSAHAYGASLRNPWSIEWFHAAGPGGSEIVQRLKISHRLPVLALRHGAWDSLLFEEALASLESGFTDASLLHAALTLGHLLGRIVVLQKEAPTGHPSLDARLEKTAAFVRENHARPLSVPEMASFAGMSLSHFAVLFAAHTGHPPMDYLIRTRINRACQLLDFTDHSIKEIAGKVGYSDPYYFSRIFKRITDCSPKAYRRKPKG